MGGVEGVVLALTISIHAPPRGATPQLSEDAKADIISIHAPPRGATATAYSTRKQVEISIHAPPRGATNLRPEGSVIVMQISIHAPPRGATRGDLPITAGAAFQFTPLREGRLRYKQVISCPGYFNSRPSARGDSGRTQESGAGHISIHAPPRGATTVSVYDSPRGAISIHAPPRGATQMYHNCQANGLFQFTPLREGRQQRAVG